MFDKNKIPKEFEELSKAITEAIMQSPEVRKIIEQILGENRSLTNNLLVLVMKFEILKGGLRSKIENSKGLGSKSSDIHRQSTKNSILVEGEKLPPDEMAFLDYCAKIFNEEKWLRENKLIFPQEKLT